MTALEDRPARRQGSAPVPDALENEAFNGRRRVLGQLGDIRDRVGQRREGARICHGMLLLPEERRDKALSAYGIPAEGAFPNSPNSRQISARLDHFDSSGPKKRSKWRESC